MGAAMNPPNMSEAPDRRKGRWQLILILLIGNIVIVQQSKAYVVERLGAFHSVWGVGLHLKVPFIERVVKKVSLKEQVADFDPQPVITKDNVTMQIDTVIYFQITDPKLYTYGVENPMSAIENLTATTLRNIIGELELDQSLTSRDTINAKMRAILDEAQWHLAQNADPNAANAFTEKLAALVNHFERAMVTYLDHNPFWRGATHFYHADTLSAHCAGLVDQTRQPGATRRGLACP